MKKVSILVPVYNVEKYIERCAKSLFNQDYENIEYIFVNDCTTDRSIEIINNLKQLYPNRANQIHIINHQQNQGLGAARLTALDAANGYYVLIVDSDDWIESDTVSSLVTTAEKNNSDLVFANHYFAYQQGVKQKKTWFNPDKNQFLSDILIRKNNISVSIWNKLIKRELFLQAKPEKGLDFGEDFAVLPRLIYLSQTISYLDNYTYYYWQGNPNSYVKNFSQKSYDNIVRATNILSDFFNINSKAVPSDILHTMYLKTKVLLLSAGTKEQKKAAYRLWPNIKYTTYISSYEKLILFLASIRAYRLIDFIRHSGVSIKNFLRN